MADRISLITPTGGRPEALKICEKFVKRFYIPSNTELEWIVVLDTDSAFDYVPHNDKDHPYLNIKQVKGYKPWQPGINTQHSNMLAGIERVTGNYVFVIEDDDYYAKNYIQAMLHLLQFWNFAGEGHSIYYNIREMSWRHQNNWRHASLCQTALISDYLDILKECVLAEPLYIDLMLFEKLREKNLDHVITNYQGLCVGMKGLPGKGGIGTGHTPKGFIPDPGYKKLKSLVGDDFSLYEEIITTMQSQKAV